MSPSASNSPDLRAARGSLVRGLALGSLALLALAAGRPAAAQCIAGTSPAKPAATSLWGDLQAVDLNPLPVSRDSTNFTLPQHQYSSFNFFTSVDVEGGWVIAGTAYSLQVWDNRANPVEAKPVGEARHNVWPVWINDLHAFFPLLDVDAPKGNPDMAAMVGEAGVGIGIFNLANKSKPALAYQSHHKNGRQVYAATVGGTSYAFMASDGGDPSGGLYVYNMTKAVQFRGCSEGFPALGNPIQCDGVYVGRVGSVASGSYIDGVDNYVALTGDGGVKVFDVSNIGTAGVANLQPKLVGLTGVSAYGVALWKQGIKYYLGVTVYSRDAKRFEMRIYDASCLTGTCSGLGAPLSVRVVKGGSRDQFLTYSQDGATHYLYAGTDDGCNDGTPQREFLFNVTDPANPDSLGSEGYWDWYYGANYNGTTVLNGYSRVSPRQGKVWNGHFYRAAHTILDVHKVTVSGPPVADFTYGPTEIYPGTPVNFTDTSAGAPTSWGWTFADGTPGSAAVQNPQVTFGSQGSKAVTLQVSNQNSTSPSAISKNVTVLDPAPQVGSVSVSPAAPVQCQPVTLKAENVTGKPPLTYSWSLSTSAGPVPAANNTASTLVWDSTGAMPGAYTATVTVNGVGSAQKSATFNLGALPQMPSAGTFAPTNDPFSAGHVQFHVNAPGATEWNWSFGDGTTTGWVNDPVTGPNPAHDYQQVGSYDVTVQIRNCIDQTPRTSSALAVNVVQIAPLAAAFQAVAGAFCTSVGCSATVGQPITFEDASTGATTWEFDWNGNGFNGGADDQTVTESGFTVVDGKRRISHTYTTSGSYSPKLRVKRPGEQSPFYTHSTLVVGSGSASISISGPTSGLVGTSYTYLASATGCTPGTWSWSAGSGGTVASAIDNAVSIAWSTTGSKTVTATASGCGSAQGSWTVTIGGGGGGGSTELKASFSFTPTSPKAGEAVSFNGGASTGSPEEYSWDFGDGSTAHGQTASHSFAQAGSYPVKLAVLKHGNCPLGICFHETTRSVVVGGGGPTPPSAEFTPNVDCFPLLGHFQCQAGTGQTVTLTAQAEGADSYDWSFGDGKSGSGRTVTHSWANPGTYSVSLTVAKGGLSATGSRVFEIDGDPVAVSSDVLLPWIAQTHGALEQSSDLYIFNPGRTAMKLDLKFLKRGQPEVSPPAVERTIPAGATLFVADVLLELFERENIAGFVTLVVKEGDAVPVVTSFNTTFGEDGSRFGQTVPGVSLSRTAATQGGNVQHLIGLNENSERLAYFGVSNPNESNAVYRLRFFDRHGAPIGGQTGELVVSRFGQKQFQARELAEAFGVTEQDDFRIEVETVSGGPIFPYGANVRLASDDPSFIPVGSPADSKVYLIGALSTPGLNRSLWETDIVLGNVGSGVALTDVTFTSAGVAAEPVGPVSVSLPAGSTMRLVNAVAEKLGIDNTVGVLTLESDSTNGVFPIVLGESYDNARPHKRFGQSMVALTESHAAGPGGYHYLVGLRQDADYRTTFWVFNPGEQAGVYEVIYRALDGRILGRLDVTLGPGKLRQVNPGHHPAPISGAGIQNGFTVEVAVKSGKVLTAAQVVNNKTNDPAYIQGERR
jgi:PKD repeat protein